MKKIKINLSQKSRHALVGYAFLSFYLVGLAAFFLPAVVRSIQLCFSENNASFELKWVGLDNFHFLFRVDPNYVRDIVETVGGLLVNALIIIFYSIFVCTLLNRRIKGRGVLRALLFLPVVMSMGVIDKYMSYTVRASDILTTASAAAGGGISLDYIASMLGSYSIGADISGVIVGAIRNIYTIISHSGVQVVIFLAGLQSINPSIYEAAHVEGCGAWEAYWKITIPMLTPVISVNVVYTVIDSFVSSDNIIMSQVFAYQTGSFRFGLAAAMAWVYFIILITVLVIVMALLRKFAYYEDLV